MTAEGKLRELDDLNTVMFSCTRCSLSETRSNVLSGEGDPDSRIVMIALSPGHNEDRGNRMFIGPSGRVLDSLLASAGTGRGSFYITNLVKCTLPKNRRPRLIEIESCKRFLLRELSIVRPEILVPLGYYATRTVLREFTDDPPESGADYVPLYGSLVPAGKFLVYPLPHPASLLYDPSRDEGTRRKYLKLKVLLQRCRWYSCCPMKRYFEKGSIGYEWVRQYCWGDWRSCRRYELEEKGEYHPDWMMPDGSLEPGLKGK